MRPIFFLLLFFLSEKELEAFERERCNYSHPQICLEKGNSSFKNGNYEEAYTYYQKCRRLPACLNNMAVVSYYMGNTNKSQILLYIRKACKQGDQIACYNLKLLR